MKHILLTFLFCLWTMLLCAQAQNHDVIITHTSERIDAVITEVTSSEIKYKQADFQNGPTFVISKNDIASIIYSNGQVQTFQPTQPTQQQAQPFVQQYQQPIYQNTPYYGGQAGPLTCIGNDIYMNGRPLNAYEYSELLRRNCPMAYNEYRSGLIMQYCGWTFLGAGIPLMAIGLALAIEDDDVFWGMAGAGIGFTLTSIPLLAVGYPRARNSYRTYNQYTTGYPITLNLQANKNGIGLALNF